MTLLKPLILVNSSSRGGTAERIWSGIKDKIINRFPEEPIIFFYDFPLLGNGYNELDEIINKNQINTLISAGGDGSVNFLANYLINRGNGNHISLGAVGLGSSNDFHKPMGEVVNGIPLRLNYQSLIQNDIGKVEFLDSSGKRKSKYFIINASIGVTAEANVFFNRNKGIIHYFKKRWTQGAILYAALRTIFVFRNFSARLEFGGKEKAVKLTNLSVLKSPHVSGTMKYDQEINPGDGMLGLNYCCEMNIPDLLRLMNDLGKGCFQGKPKRFSYYTTSLHLQTKKPVALETDGEVEKGTDFKFSILPRAITTLGYN